jgi:hypothetical protein
MAGVRTESIRREGMGAAIINFSLQTSLGRFPLELKISGGDSMGDLEKTALRELEKVLTESLDALRQSPA